MHNRSCILKVLASSICRGRYRDGIYLLLQFISERMAERDDIESAVNELVSEMDELKESIHQAVSGVTYTKSGNRATWGYDESRTVLIQALSEYEQWYNSAYPLILDYLPDRKTEFENRYDRVRRGLEVDLGFVEEHDINSASGLRTTVMMSVQFQIDLVSSIPSRVEARELKVTKQVSNNIVSNEIQKAKELLEDEHTRAAGVITGVALERHLLSLCETSNQELDFGYMDGITSLAQTLSDAGEITDDDQRNLEYLSGIRNNCSHASGEEPKQSAVERMANQADDFIQKSKKL